MRVWVPLPRRPRLRSGLILLTLPLALPLLLSTACDRADEPFPMQPVVPAGPNAPLPPEPMSHPGTEPVLLSRAPYLQLLGADSVIIAFRTQTVIEACVDFGLTRSYGSTVCGPAAERHAIELSGLQPGARYYYRVRTPLGLLASGDEYFFDTDGGLEEAEFSFFATGDIGMSRGRLFDTSERIRQFQPRAELGIICGDVVYDSYNDNAYDKHLMSPMAGLLSNTVLWPALGNHDWVVDPETHFRQEWYLPNNEHYYSFDHGNAHFVALDTQHGHFYDRTAQLEWLRHDLEAHRDAPWTFLYYHHAGYTCTYKGYAETVIAYVHPIIDEFAVDMVFTGHAHTYERLFPMRGDSPVDQDQEPDYVDPAGTVYVTTGSGSSPAAVTTPDCELNAVAIDRVVLFTHVMVQGNRLTLRTVASETGAVLDEMTITKTIGR